MTFVHDDPEFAQLLAIVARDTGIAIALIEAALPHPDEPALALEDALRRAEIERAYQKIAPMFWGARLSLDEACTTIRGWLTTLRKDDRVR